MYRTVRAEADGSSARASATTRSGSRRSRPPAPRSVRGGPVWLLATVGEEGLGNLRGVRAALDPPPAPVAAFVAVEGNYLGRVSAVGVGSVRRRVRARPRRSRVGGRGRPERRPRRRDLVAAIASIPRAGTSVNVGRVGGGRGSTSGPESLVRARPTGRRSGGARLARAEVELLGDRGRPHRRAGVLGDRPAGGLDRGHPLVRAAAEALDEVGVAVAPATSTDANAAHARGIPAIAVGVTRGSGEHTPQEWIEIAPIADGLRRSRGPSSGSRSCGMSIRSGVVLQGAYPPEEFREMVEDRRPGVSNLWLTDSSLHARNSYAYLTLAATSPRLLLGTAVTNPLTRHPAITAVAAATVDEISGGRMILGIGAGDRPLLALGMRPRARLRARLDRRDPFAVVGRRRDRRGCGLRAADAHLRFGARSDIPIYISASGPKTLELAGEIADGVILLIGLFPEALAVGARSHRSRRRDRGPVAPPRCRVRVRSDRRRRGAGARGGAADRSVVPADRTRGLRARRAAVVASIRFASGTRAASSRRPRRRRGLLPDDFVRKVALAGDAAAGPRAYRGRRGRRRGFGPRVPPGGGSDADDRGVRGLLRATCRGATAMTSQWRVTGLHHVAIAHGDDAVCEDALASMIGARRITEDGPGFLERMYEVGPVVRPDAGGHGRRRGAALRRQAGTRAAPPGVRGRRDRRRARRPADRGVPLIDREARAGGMGTRIAFLHPSAFGGVLVELVEPRRVHGATLGEGEG